MSMNAHCSRVALLVCALCVLLVADAKRIVASDHHGGPSFWRIVESIPEGLELETNRTTFQAWHDMIVNAKESIQVGAFYMDFYNGSQYLDAEGQYGVIIFNALVDAAKRGVKIQIAVQASSPFVPNSPDAIVLAEMGAAEVRYVNWSNVATAGILHTKIIIADNRTVYIGSSNIAWDSLTQVKELGIVFTNSKEVAEDALKIWSAYWYMGATNMTQVPSSWPASFDTIYNASNPMSLKFGQETVSVFISANPTPLLTPYRTPDLEAILATVAEADEYVYGEVMDYSPTTLYLTPNVYFPALDTAFRAAPFNKPGVQVRLLFGLWNQTICQTVPYLQSLALVANVTVRAFRVPDLANVSPQVPFTRVNHAKFIVTDQRAFITTSNWAGDYFLTTGGMSVNAKNAELQAQLTDIFLRDWNSPYASDICLQNCSFEPCNPVQLSN